MREICSGKKYSSDLSNPYDLKTASPEFAANTLLCLINQASFLLGRQLQRLEQNFLQEGGFTERLYRKRKRTRKSGSTDKPVKP
jgi:restriction system protein